MSIDHTLSPHYRPRPRLAIVAGITMTLTMVVAMVAAVVVLAAITPPPIIVAAELNPAVNPAQRAVIAVDSASPTVPPEDNPYLPEDRAYTECVSALPKPGCGSEVRGGWTQNLVFVAIIAAIGFIGWRVYAAANKAKRAATTTMTTPTTTTPTNTTANNNDNHDS